MKFFCGFILLYLSLGLLIAVDEAGGVIGWRNDGSGSYEVQKAPQMWSQTENVRWKVDFKSRSNTSPVVVGPYVFTCVEPSTLVCMSKKDGNVLWRKTNELMDSVDTQTAETLKVMAPTLQKILVVEKKIKTLRRKLRKDRENASLRSAMNVARKTKKQLKSSLPNSQLLGKFSLPQTHKENGFCSYIPVSDGAFIYAAFGNGVLACYDMQGTRMWAAVDSAPKHYWGGSTSPVLAGSVVITGFNDYVAYDRATGKERWRIQEKIQSFGTPVVTKVDGVALIITPQGRMINADNGTVIDDNLFTATPYNAAIVDKGVVYAVGGRGEECIAIRLPRKLGGESETLWKVKVKKNRYYGSPLLHDGMLYVVNRSGFLTVLDASNGSKFSEQAIDNFKDTVYGSPTAAGGHVYITNDKGSIVVLQAGKNPTLVHNIQFEKNRSNPFFEEGLMYFKSNKSLYCIGAR